MKNTSGDSPNKRLRSAREQQRWSQQDLAEFVEVHRTTVNHWENQGVVPVRYLQDKLCELFGKTRQELGFLSESGKPTTEKRDRTLLDPFIPIALSGTLIGRNPLRENLKDHLMSSPRLALNGLPGVGKTALALSLVSDPEIQEQFRDGILWATLGTQPDRSEILNRWGTLFEGITSSTDASNHHNVRMQKLRDAIGTRRLLIVLDDVWEIRDAMALSIFGPQCTYLLTTRFPRIAASFAHRGARFIPELSEEDGLVLLQHLAPEITRDDTESLRRLVCAVGALPLALTLAGRYLHIQAYHGQRRRLLLAIERLQDTNHRLQLSEPFAIMSTRPDMISKWSLSVQSAIAASVHTLSEPSGQALSALSVFPAKPNTFSEEAAMAVSGTPVDVLDELSDAGLLEVDNAGRYMMHQTVTDYAHNFLVDRAPLQRFVTYYRIWIEKHQTDVEMLERESQNLAAALEAAHTLKEHKVLIQNVKGEKCEER